MAIDTTTDLEQQLIPNARLNRWEFLRLYEAFPDHTSFELIEGIVHMASPVSTDHQRIEKLLSRLLDRYELATYGVEYLCEQTLHLGTDTTVEPDVLVRLHEDIGGECHETPERYLSGPPVFIIEVANTSITTDLQLKRQIYAEHGVPEYLVVDLSGHRVHWFDLRLNQELSPDQEGICRLHHLPGCWLNADAILNEDFESSLMTLQAGLASPEHAAFVAELAKRRIITPPG